jgi:hypothetical protein
VIGNKGDIFNQFNLMLRNVRRTDADMVVIPYIPSDPDRAARLLQAIRQINQNREADRSYDDRRRST